MVYYVGVDVGTNSVRAGLVNVRGLVQLTAEQPVTVWTPRTECYEQSSDQIWTTCCTLVQKVTRGVRKDQIKGIGFAATCSLVVLDRNFNPLPVSPHGEDQRNVVMWMDHRAKEQASRITSSGHGVLSRVGGVMSPEMQPPKLLWLKENVRESCWNKAAHFMDLPDFLSWKATGSLTRSLCPLVCKWTYCPLDGWDEDFWTRIGLEDLLEDNFSKIGSEACSPGGTLGTGLTHSAAADLGLEPGTAVGASLIDAHAGGLGVIGADVRGFRLPCENRPITSRMAVICGTSTCHMASSESAVYVPGVWGPYQSAMIPGLWLNEGGQSSTGRLIEHMVKGHAAFTQLQELAGQRIPCSDHSIYHYLNLHLTSMRGSQGAADLLTSMRGSHGAADLLTSMRGSQGAADLLTSMRGSQGAADLLTSMRGSQGAADLLTSMRGSQGAVDLLTSSLHVWPDFHGNRSPLADPTLKGMVCGLSLSQTLDDLALLYLATLQGLALGTRHILETMKEAGYDITTLFLCGGLSKNSLFVQIHANATGLPVVLPNQTEAVLVGASILGACASKHYDSIQEAMEKMAKVGHIVWPDSKLQSFYERKYKVFLRLFAHQREYKDLMENTENT